MTNTIIEENALTEGVQPKSYWDVAQSDQIEGFTTDFSVNAGTTIDFKINVNGGAGSDYTVEIFRLGYYGGNGAREVAEWTNTNATVQPDASVDLTLGLVDAGNWSVTDSWAVPEDAVSGVYLARLQRLDANGQPIEAATSQIPFIVRNDGAAADIVLQTSDTTWQAYNGWGGNNGQLGANFYGDLSGTIDHPDVADPGLGAQDRAYAVSYNRPFLTRDAGGAAAGAQDYLFGADYAAIYWLEKNGYNVTYISGVDTDRLGTSWFEDAEGNVIRTAYISVGHDEYWSGDQRANVEAARDAGVNLLFWSGNEVYWKTRYEDGIGGSTDDYRTLVSYKETWANGDPNAGPQDYANIDPSAEWTGTWRDLRFVGAVDANGNPTATGQEPENSLTGQLFGPDGTGEFGGALDVPLAFAGLRLWRDTTVADGGALDLAPGILGYEWDTSPEDAYRPAGLIKLSETTIPWSAILVDQGNRTEAGVATHNLSLYRDPESNALVFGAGTVFWSWALSDEHDSSPYGANIENTAIQQFTVNLFADMGIQPGVSDAILASQGLVRASASTDTIAATTSIIDLPDTVSALSNVLITGTAADFNGTTGAGETADDGKVAVVEISLDGGSTWKVANTTDGWATWNYLWRPSIFDVGTTKTILARAIDDSLNVSGVVAAQETVTISEPVAPDSLSLFDPSSPTSFIVGNDGQQIELGMKFTVDRAGDVTQLKYYRSLSDSGDTDVRDGHLWGPDGALIGTATFTSNPGETGWQTASLDTPVALLPGVEYIVSYRTLDNYVASSGYFAPANEVTFDSLDDDAFTDPFGIVSAPQDAASSPNGIYAYGSSLVIPSDTYNASNYWVDVVFAPADAGANTPPSFTSPTSYSVAENHTVVGSVAATDLDGNALTYAITGGADAAQFSINAVTGALAFKTAPDFEAPTDIGGTAGDNIYEVTVAVSDSIAAPVTQTISVTVTNVDEAAMTTTSIFTGEAPASGSTDGNDYELGTKFTASQNGTITGLQYYRVADDSGDTDNRTLNLWDVNGNLLGSVLVTSAPAATGWQLGTLSSPVAIQSGQTYIVSYGYNYDGVDDVYSYTGSFFTAPNSSPDGVLTAPTSGAPSGSSSGGLGNGLYNDTVGAFPQNSFNAGNYWVDVVFEYATTGNTAPTITSNGGDTPQPIVVNENTTFVTTVTATDSDVPAQTLTYSKAGGEDAALFNIDPSTGVLSFVTAPDYEALPPAGATPGYQVTVQVSDGNGGVDTQALSITVQDAQEGTGNSSTFDGSQIEVSYVFGTVPGVAATDSFGSDAVQTVTPNSAPATLDVQNLPEPGPDIGNGIYGLSTVDFGDTTIRIEFPLDSGVFSAQLAANSPVNFAAETGQPYNGVLIKDFGNNLAAIRSVSIIDQAGFSIPLTVENLTVTADSIFLNVNNPTDGNSQQQARLVDSDSNIANGIQSSYVTLSVDFVDEQAALLSGNYWSGIERTNTPVFVTYSFPTTAPASHDSITNIPIDFETFQALSIDQQNQARTALQEWANASGITLLEVAPGQGQINFALYDFTVDPNSTGAGGAAYNPFGDWNGITYTNFPTEAAFFSDSGDGITDASGDVFINAAALPPSGEIPYGLLLHEIGHALGLKHPFETGYGGTGVFHDVLDPALDNTDNTVMSYTLGANGEPTALGSLDVLAVQMIYGLDAQDGTQVASWDWNGSTLTQVGFDGVNDIMRGVSVADNMSGGTGDDRLFGLGGNDTLDGGDGADELWGGFGNDTLTGGEGADTFYMTLFDPTGPQADVITDFNVAEDVINLQVFGPYNFTGPASFETVQRLLYSDGLGNTVISASWNDNVQSITLLGIADPTSLTSANFGFDQFPGSRDIQGTSGGDFLFGGPDNDTLTGTGGADVLFGDAGTDTLTGGDGNDKLIGGLGIDTMTGGLGNDLYYVDNAGDVIVENAGQGTDSLFATVDYTLADDQSIEFLRSQSGGTPINLVGNNLNNWLSGGLAADTLTGGAGNDTLEGRSSSVTMIGGTGDDVYYVDDAGDTVVEGTGGGYDKVFASANWVLGGGQEVEFLKANAGATGLALTGNERANWILGGSGSDTLDGAGGDDTIDGGLGADTMIGGSGNDVFYVDDAGDSVIEGPGGGVLDKVLVSANWTLTDGQEVELVQLTAAVSVTGNSLNNWLLGSAGSDTLDGAAGNDKIDGGLGADVMIGGLGNDLFYVDNAGDSVGEAIGGGTDSVYTKVNWILTAGQEVEFLRVNTATGLSITGNDLSNQLYGNNGADTLNGGGGRDYLFGGAGADTFAFSDNWGTDQVLDFQDGVDKFDLTAVTGLDSFSQLSITQIGTSAYVAFGANAINIYNTNVASLTVDDFLV